MFGEGLDSPQMVTDGAGDVLSTFVYAGESPMLRIGAGGQPVYYLTDAMGTVLALADGSGSAVARFAHDAFGRERESTGAAAALPAELGGDVRYHGQWQDSSTGLYHVRARTYDPETGLFTSRDPVEGVTRQPETFHPYTWNANNPHAFRDPTGRWTLTELSVSNGIKTTLQNASTASLRKFFIDYARDEAIGVAGDLFAAAVQDAVEGIVPGLEFGIDLLGDWTDDGAPGKFFDHIIQETVCGLIPDALEDWLFLYVGMNQDGSAADNGVNCSKPFGTFSNSVVRPDFVFSKYPPEELKGQKKSFTSGDIKIGPHVLLSQSSPSGITDQFQAIIAHAQNHSHSHMAFFITWYAPTKHQQRALLKRAERDKVIIFVFSVSDKTRKR